MNFHKLRKQIHLLLEPNKGKRRSVPLNYLIMLLILLDASLMMLATDEAFKEYYASFLRKAEIFTSSAFALEYFLRIWVSVESRKDRFEHPIKGRIRYILSFLALIDLLSFLPFFLTLTWGINLEILRPVRLLKMFRYSTALSTLVDAVKAEGKLLAGATGMMGILLLFLATIMFNLEHQAQPDVFSSIGDALWWGIVTLTTVGYGDIVPKTDLGRLVGGFTTMLGLCMFAIPATVLSTSFAQEAKKRDFVVTWNLVAKVPLLSQLSASVIAEIAGLLKPRFATSGEYIIREGESGDSMYFVVDGAVEVRYGQYPVRLQSGSFFGEIGLLGESKKRTADVIVVANTQLLKLEYNDFKKILEEHPEIEKSMRIVAKRRLLSQEEGKPKKGDDALNRPKGEIPE